MQAAEAGEYTLKDNLLELEKGTQAVHDVVIAHMAGERAGTASTKTRSDVRGGGAKPYRQKGTGRARAGTKSSPVWTGGGVTFGPKPRDYDKKVNKKVKKLALKRAFSEQVKAESVTVLDELTLADHKTKNVQKLLDSLKMSDARVLLVVKEYDETMLRATRNIASLCVISAKSVNVYQLLYSQKVIFTKEALDAFTQRLA